MIIFCFSVKSLDEYLKQKEKIGKAERLKRCLNCGEWDCYWRNGGYRRKVDEGGESVEIFVERFECRWCGKTVSVLPCFVVPKRRYTMKLIAQGVESYATTPTSYRQAAGQLGIRPSVSQLFKWVALLSGRASELLLDVQRQCVSSFAEDEELEAADRVICPNAWKVQIERKDDQLNALAKVVSFGKVLLQKTEDTVLARLGMLFLRTVEGMQQIIAHQNYWKSTPQKMKPLIF
jgi:hypothetical protein